MKTFEQFVRKSKKFVNEAKVTVPYEGDPKDAAKEYNIKIKNKQRGRDGLYVTTFTGTKENLLRLLDEFGGEDNVLNTMDEPYGRITESKNL